MAEAKRYYGVKNPDGTILIPGGLSMEQALEVAKSNRNRITTVADSSAASGAIQNLGEIKKNVNFPTQTPQNYADSTPQANFRYLQETMKNKPNLSDTIKKYGLSVASPFKPKVEAEAATAQEDINKSRAVSGTGLGIEYLNKKYPPNNKASSSEMAVDLSNTLAAIPEEARKDPAFGVFEDQIKQKRELEKPKSAGFYGLNINSVDEKESNALAEAVRKGLLNPYKINSRNQKMMANMAIKYPGMDLNKLAAAGQFEGSQQTQSSVALLSSIDAPLQQLLDAGHALGQSHIQFYNAGKNFISEHIGNKDIVRFNNLRNGVVQEYLRGLTQVGVSTDAKMRVEFNNIKAAQSYPQLEAAIQVTRDIIKARLDAIASGTDVSYNPETKETKKQPTEQPVPSAEQPVPSAAGLPKFSSPNDPAFVALPSGSKFLDSKGVTRTKK